MKNKKKNLVLILLAFFVASCTGGTQNKKTSLTFETEEDSIQACVYGYTNATEARKQLEAENEIVRRNNEVEISKYIRKGRGFFGSTEAEFIKNGHNKNVKYYVSRHQLNSAAQNELLVRNDPQLIATYIKAGKFFEDVQEVNFIKTSNTENVITYITKWKLGGASQLALVLKNDYSELLSYLRSGKGFVGDALTYFVSTADEKLVEKYLKNFELTGKAKSAYDKRFKY